MTEAADSYILRTLSWFDDKERKQFISENDLLSLFRAG
jgi:hypothetical protein